MGQVVKGITSIFTGPELPDIPEPDTKTEVDPNREAELAGAAKRRREVFSRRGRSFLRRGGRTRGGLSVGGQGGKPTAGGDT
jgi:hypothetical protein